MWRKLTAFGMAGALAYALHVVLGGLLWKGYSHLEQPISDLTAQGAPDRALLTGITSVYALFSIIFAVSAFMYVRRLKIRLLSTGFILFILMHIVSASYNIFPEDLAGAPATFRGIMHWVVTGAIVPLTILSVLLIGLGFRRVKGFGGYSAYSIVTSAILFIAGGTTVFILSQGLGFFGLFERINIGSLQLWMFLVSLKLFNTEIGEGHISSRQRMP